MRTRRGATCGSSARPETWPSKFCAGTRERLALPGEIKEGAVFVSSDATKVIMGAIAWTNGKVMRMNASAAARWVWQRNDHDDDEVAIHVAEMLSFLAFACRAGPSSRSSFTAAITKWFANGSLRGKMALCRGDWPGSST